MCGNGIRCVAKYVYDHKLTDKTEITVETGAGVLTLILYPENGKVQQVRVDMGEPILTPAEIPVIADGDKVINQPIDVGGKTWNMTCVSMGNPHAVVFVEDTANFELEKYGPLFENHERFPKRQILSLFRLYQEQKQTCEFGSEEALRPGLVAQVLVHVLWRLF